ncbi:mitochondrial carrier domain-containing protein [Crepidotus variabilis]|uniref:Mitochondrial carrier domain-containing protein n=1 Tax=Crepidotus variabilis TaxID=179855 RepID=A0A9P6JJH4_9AGAR|nr:mitochondrial carrier domain-containing protein [Crepidotus variabilis]
MAGVQAGDVIASSNATAMVDTENNSLVFNPKEALKEIAVGSVAGMMAELFEYPFDLAKVRLQAQLLAPPGASETNALRFNGPLHCLAQTWKAEGIRGLYRGLPVPVVGSMAETASVFATYTTLQNVIRSFAPSTESTSKTAPLSLSQLGLASAGAGFVTSFVLTPVELIKCKMQVQLMNLHPSLPASSTSPSRVPIRPLSSLLPSVPPLPLNLAGSQAIHGMAGSPATVHLPKLPGVIQLTREVIAAQGVRGLWLGHTGTLLRETGGCAAWFVSKEWMARKLIERRLGPKSTSHDAKPLIWESGVSGAIAGAIGALVLYPADTIKSAIQTEEELMKAASRGGNKPSVLLKKSTFTATFKRMWATHGMKGLYAGCGMTVTRAVPSSGIIFVVYDTLTAWFS